MTKWKPHGTLDIKISYARGQKDHHDPEIPLVTERIQIKGRKLDSLIMGVVPDRKWFYPVTGDAFTAEQRVAKRDLGSTQLERLSNEGLEVLRNTLGNLHREATRILNERGSRRYSAPLQEGPPEDFLSP